MTPPDATARVDGGCSRRTERAWRRKLDYPDAAAVLNDLRAPPGNRLEALKGNRAGQHSIRGNDQYRVCFSGCLAGVALIKSTSTYTPVQE